MTKTDFNLSKLKLMKTFYFIFIILICATTTKAQDQKRNFFMGLQPSLTKEKFYEKNEFDINVFPVVLQTGISKRVDIRLITLANYHFGNAAQFSDLGIELASPIFLKKKETPKSKSKGFFLSPVLGLSTNLMNEHNTINAIAEAGYFFLIGQKFALSASVQYGRSFFFYHHQENENVQHFGVKVNVGLWW